MSTNQVYQTMLKNEQNKTVFGHSGHVSHGKIDTLPEWQAMDKQATAFINSLPDKKRITTIDKARTNNFLKAGYGLTAEALSSERANKFSSEWAVQGGMQAKLPFTHETFNTAGDIFDAVTQEKMALDLASHTEALQNNKVAYGSPKNNKNEIFGSKEIVSDAAPLTFEPLPSMQVSDEQISSYVETLETEKSKVGVNDHYYDTNDVPKMSLVPEKQKSESFETLHAPNFGVDNPMISSPGTPGSLASAIDQKNADNEQLVADAKIHEAAEVGQELKAAWKDGVKNFNELAKEKAEKETKRSNLSDQGNNTYLDNNKITRDAFGREIEVGNGYDLHSGITPADKSNNAIAADPTLNTNAQDAFKTHLNSEKVLDEIAEERKKKEWEEYKLRSQERTRENFEDALDTSTPPDTMGTNLASIKDAEGKKISYPKDIHGIGTPIAEQTSNAEELAAEKAKKENETELHNNQINNPTADDMGRSAEEEAKLKADAFRKKMDDAHKSYRPRTGPVEKSKTREKYATHGDKLGTPDLLTGKDPFRFSTLAYPMNITTDPEYGHYMLFYVNVQNKTGYKYAGYNDDDQLALIGDVIETQTYSFPDGPRNSFTTTSETIPAKKEYTTNYHVNRGAEFDDVAYHKSQHYNGLRGNHLQSNQVTLMRQRKATTGLAARVNTTTRITDSVAMYLPGDVTSNVSASYQGSDMGLLGFLALGGADVINQVKNRDFEGAADNFLGMGERALSEMIKKAGIAAVETAFGTSGTTEVFNKIFGQTTNPFLEVAFQNLGLRQFDYTFNFRPRSQPETDEVKAIIQLFRFHMAPELKGTNHRYMTLPSTFDIHYMYQSDPETATENSFYNKIATCVLERCDVNYTPTGVKSFDDGAPTEITMSLSFKETELLTKQKINDGF